ncbi:hypothetical protein JYK21_00130 [Ralstonia pickettii]|nr:hypothetical protein [Ralstonia pickettii]
MALSQQRPGNLFQQSEKGYLQFLMHYLKMQISSLQAMSLPPSSRAVQEYAEKQLVISLTLVNNIFIHFHSRNILASDYIQDDTYVYKEGQIDEIEYLILQFKLYLKKSDFFNESYKSQCKQLIDQLSKYFYKDRLKIINPNPDPPKPWFNSNSFFSD